MMKELSSCTVLIVDDTEANIDILVAALDSEYEVSVAMDGESALVRRKSRCCAVAWGRTG